MRLLSLAVGGWLVDLVGIRPIFWAGGTLLLLAGLLGLRLLGGYAFQPGDQQIG